MPTTEAQRRANQKQDGTRKRVPIWLAPKVAKRLDAAVRRLELPSRAAFVEHALAHEQKLAKKVSDE